MAITSSLLDKLQAIRLRFEEIGTQLTDPSVISDTKRYIKLNKEYKDLEELVAVSMEYKNILDNIESTKALLKEKRMRKCGKWRGPNSMKWKIGYHKWRRKSRFCSCPPIPKMKKMWWSKSARERVATRPAFLPATSFACTPNFVKTRAGR